MTFYHLDRNNLLNPGQTIELVQYKDVTPQCLQQHFNSLFPYGVSNHGERYTFEKNNTDTYIELVFEYVRRYHFPYNPSRFQSVFAFETIKEVITFLGKYAMESGQSATLWELECNKFFRADMTHLRMGSDSLTFSYNAHSYWKCLPSESPLWEMLLTPPVYVVKKVMDITG